MNLSEQFTKYAHESWSRWMLYVLEESIENKNGDITISKKAVKKWKRKVTTEYKDLLDEEKNSDRIESREIMRIIHANIRGESEC